MSTLERKFARAVPFAKHVLEHFPKDRRLRDAAMPFVSGKSLEPQGSVEVFRATNAEGILLHAAQRIVEQDELYRLVWGRPPRCSIQVREGLQLARELLQVHAAWHAERVPS